MLCFTPDVKDALEWFQLTYQPQGGYGWVQWQRTSLPVAGGVEDQPAKLMEALTLIAREENAALTKRSERKQKRQPKLTRRDG